MPVFPPTSVQQGESFEVAADAAASNGLDEAPPCFCQSSSSAFQSPFLSEKSSEGLQSRAN